MMGMGGHGLPSNPVFSGPISTTDTTQSTSTTTGSGIFAGGVGIAKALFVGEGANAASLTVSGSTIPANGMYLPAANTVAIATSSALRWSFTSNFAAVDSAGPLLAGTGATATIPTLVPNRADSNTGIGWSSADVLSLVAGGVSQALFSGAAGSELATFAGDVTLSEGKLTITDTANETAFSVVASSTTTNTAVVLCNTLTTGSALFVTSNSANTSGRSVANIVNDNTAATGAVNLRLQQDAANAFADFVGTAAANTTDPISTLTTPGAVQGFVQVDINGTKRWMAIYADPS